MLENPEKLRAMVKETNANSTDYESPEEVDVLWQILFYRRMGLELSTIEGIIKDPAFNPLEALRAHLDHLYKEEQNLRLLIETVKRRFKWKKGR